MSNCFVPGCKTGYSSQRKHFKELNEKVPSLFGVRFKNDELLERWRIAIRRADRLFSYKDKICELHFAESDIERFYVNKGMPDGTTNFILRDRPVLKHGAVPTLFLNRFSKEMQRKKAPVATKKKTCFVPGCKTGYLSDRKQRRRKGEKNCTLFSPPTGHIFELWKMFIPRKDRELSKNDVVCELHFTENCIERFIDLPGTNTARIPLEVPRLKTGSIPTIFPNDPKPSVTKDKKPKHSEKTVSQHKNVTSILKCLSTLNRPICVSNDCTVTDVLSNQPKPLENIVNSNVKQKQSHVEDVIASLKFSARETLSPITVDNAVLNPSISEVHLLGNAENRNPFAKIIENENSNFEESPSNLNDVSTGPSHNPLLFNANMTMLPSQPHLLKTVEIRNSSTESVSVSDMNRTDLNYPASNTCVVPDVDKHISSEPAVSTMCSDSKQPKSYMKISYKNKSDHVINFPSPDVCSNYSNDASTSSTKNFSSNGEINPVVVLDAAQPMNKTIIDELKENIEIIQIPSNWGWIQCISDSIVCVKWGENYSVERKVIFDLNLNIKVFLGEKEVILMEETPSSIEHISAILQKIDSLEICKGACDTEVPDCVVVISTARQSLSGCGRFCDNCRAYKKRKAQALWHKAAYQIISSRSWSKKVPMLKKKNKRLRKKIAGLKRKLKIEQTCTAAALDFFS